MKTNYYVITNDDQILVQIVDDNRWGFSLTSDDQTWPGGIGVASSWEIISPNDPRITEQDHEDLDWLL